MCSDSSAALASLTHASSNCRQDILCDILVTLYTIIRLGINDQFLWVPAHVGIQGHETVGHLADNGLKANQVGMIPINKTEIKSFILSKIRKQWQTLWDRDSKGRQRIQQEVRERRLQGRRMPDQQD